MPLCHLNFYAILLYFAGLHLVCHLYDSSCSSIQMYVYACTDKEVKPEVVDAIVCLISMSMLVQAKFDINTNDDPIRTACSQMMKSALHQQRYRLKKIF
jgi:hypothetical protein